ncbi:MAG: hypothetical protein K2U26_00940 [Cyclobacteriaceae bacterium]|nr:hypothetical protein [Cyclobacteriaceae bacterium]
METRKLFYLPSLVCLALLLVFPTCSKKGDDPTPPVVPETERVTALLKGTSGVPWSLSQVKIDNEVVDLYKDLRLSFTDTGFTSENGGGIVWPKAGNWRFQNDDASVIIRDDNLPVSIVNIADRTLVVSFTWDKLVFEGGRNQAAAGRHEMTFSR